MFQRRRGSITEYVSDLESDSTSIHNGDHSLPNTPRGIVEPPSISKQETHTDSPKHHRNHSVHPIHPNSDHAVHTMFNKMILENALHIHKGQELTYADFVPKFLTSNSIEPLDTIISRVNDWIENCESFVKVWKKVILFLSQFFILRERHGFPFAINTKSIVLQLHDNSCDNSQLKLRCPPTFNRYPFLIHVSCHFSTQLDPQC